ncbi:4-hydroxy-3-methylbut-2-enyl diphosphate reductase [Patescibacteria group bacterium]|nr:4-hydroxy-3-methylbut-2-enyl diphosphate reductase [Patescibacteria group bacterium]
MKIELAKSAGFCFGVRRALEMVEKNIKLAKKPIRMYGYLVHNEEVVKKMAAKGIEVINSLENICQGTLIITAHGISPKIKEELAGRKELDLIDTTCPKVLKVHSLANRLREENRQVLIFGDSDHKEVLGIKGAADGKAVVFSSVEEFQQVNIGEKIKYGLVAQTTKDFKEFKEAEKSARERADDIKIFNTICPASRERQSEARRLAKKHNVILVVGSRLSANTTRLYEICSKINPNAYFINTAKELKKEWFRGKASAGITAGASTPDWVIKEAVERVKKF